ncbi:shikimate O-hydroxycinnamoyltransferase-like [Tripterygium wilfordii]|uniref:Shikimate O-hydroxycinnamoyltransferase-like n=2 Tax=Tripterygium wilfordii TaxID=458696 RepID=A0A7J7DT02_TRIWF|nr:shikimate O-hydroxycinnamoyltransferase-like [Tripterygium wilfordii]
MEIQVKESTIVRPAGDTPKKRLWSSNMDVVASRTHVSIVFFYRHSYDSNFFDTRMLKESLSKVLVPFYPVAGRLGFDPNGRIEVDCNGEGVLFLEAHTDRCIDDFLHRFNSHASLVPVVDYSTDMSSYPLFLSQVTFFKGGGVCLGVGIHHTLFDGVSTFHFVNAWSDMTRGLSATVSPIFDHDLLRARDPPTPSFIHIEFDQQRPLYTPKETKELQSSPLYISTATLKITALQLNTLKANLTNYSTYEILAAHIWRCVCKARDLPVDEITNLYMAVDGRHRLNPPLPRGYFGNAIFKARLPSLAGEVQSEPLIQTVERVHKVIKRMDDDYMRSIIDYLEVQPHLNLVRPTHAFKCPNLHVVSWAGLPLHDADFGWGRPIYMGLASIYIQGAAYILPSPVNDGSLMLLIGLEGGRIKLFEKYFYALMPSRL